MNNFTQIVYTNSFFLLLITNTALMGMDSPYPQLQLDQPKTKLHIIHGTICIGKQTASSGGINFVHEPVYHPAAWERKYVQEAGIHFSVYDPCIPVEIKLTNSTKQLDDIKKSKEGLFLRRSIVPVKNLINLSTKSVLNLTLYGYQAELVCENNPLINNKSFLEQFEKRMQKFYNKPESWANMGQPAEDELIPAGIITKTKYAPDVVTHFRHNNLMVTGTQEFCTYAHGPKSCPNALALAKLAAGKNLLPYNNSMHRLIMNREIGQTSRVPHYSKQQVERDDFQAVDGQPENEDSSHDDDECVLL